MAKKNQTEHEQMPGLFDDGDFFGAARAAATDEDRASARMRELEALLERYG